MTITPPGGSATDYTRYLAYSGTSQQFTITQNFGRQGDTAVIPLVDEYTSSPNVIIPVQSQIKLVDNHLGTTLFAGVVTDPVLCVTAPTRNEWALNCVDYAYYADNALCQGTFIGWTVDAIVVELTRRANCGISAASVSNGGYVAPGPVLASFVLNWSTLSDAWRKLATLASQVTPYGWYVDENRRLHFYDSTTALNSGVTFTTSPITSGSATEGHFKPDSSFGYEWDGTSIHNRILVQGATQIIYFGKVATSPPTDTWLADGTATSWPLRYTLSGFPTLKLGGATTTVNVVAAGGTTSGTWNCVQNSTGSWFLTASSPPAAGTRIRIWYDYLVPVVAQANDYGSQSTYSGPNGGVFALYVSDTSLVSMPMALARARRERTEFAYAAERLKFTTSEDWVGWVRAGYTCQVINAFIPDASRGGALGINDSFLVVANTVTFGSGGYRSMQVTAVRL